MTLWAVLEGNELLEVLDDEAETCSPGYTSPCGGCTGCLFAQIPYPRCRVIPVPVDEERHETFADALGNIMSGTKIPGRVPALQTCIDRGWKAGQKITSASWKTPRKISGSLRHDPTLKIGNQAVRIMVLRADGTQFKEEFLYTFPDDVAALSATETEQGDNPSSTVA